MKLGIMQPYFFPYIGYWQLINAVDLYVIFDDVNYIKGGWINKNNLLINGEARYVSLQLQKASSNRFINQHEIVQGQMHINTLLKTIEFHYKKAPFFSNTYPVLHDIIAFGETNLAKYLEFSIRTLCKYLGIKTEIIISSKIHKNMSLKCGNKVKHMCNLLGADEYYNAIGGQKLYSYEDFKKSGIKLKFLKTNPIVYKQYKNDFIPNLSIIDVMMFNSKQEVKRLLEEYQLI